MSPDPFPPDDPSRSPAERNVVDPVVLAERRAQRAELAEQVAARRAADAQALAAELSGERARLEAELEEARREPERLSRLVAERERALRAAEQRAHAEEAQRIETAEELAARVRRHEAELAELRARAERAEALAAERESELEARGERAEALAAQRESELRALRVRLTEAEQIAAQAESARRRAELKRQSARDKRRRAVEAREQVEAELEKLQAEAQAAREGADAVIAQAAHEQRERDRLRAEVEQIGAERAALRAELERVRAERTAEREQAQAALAEARAEAEAARGEAEAARAEVEAARAERERVAEQERVDAEAARAERERLVEPPAAHGAWVERLRAELEGARTMRPAPAVRHAVPWPLAAEGKTSADSLAGALALERRLLAARGSGLPGVTAARTPTGARAIEPLRVSAEDGRVLAPATPTRAMPVTALALERERSTRLQAKLEAQAETERELREQIAELERAVASRMDAEQRIERALRRVRGELEAANALRMLTERGSSTRPLSGGEASAADAASGGPAAPPGSGLGAAGSDAAASVAGAAGSDAAASDSGAAASERSDSGDGPAAMRDTPAHGGPFAAPGPGRGPTATPDTPAHGGAFAAPATGDAAGRAPESDDAGEPALAGFDADRLNAARARLRAAAPPEGAEVARRGASDPDETSAAAPLDVVRADDAGATPSVGEAVADRAPRGEAGAHSPGTPLDAVRAEDAGATPSVDEAVAEPAPRGDGDAQAAGQATRPSPGKALVLGRAALPQVGADPTGPPAAWLPAALRRLLQSDPETAGRIVVGMLPAHGLVTLRDLGYDLVIADRGTVAVDVRDGRASVRALDGPRIGERLDFRVTATHAGLARLLLGRRGLRRRARVRGSRRRLKELRRLVQEPLTLRDLAASGATLEPALALWLAALAIDPADTFGHRFTIAHAPLPGGPADAWLRIQQGTAPSVVRTRPGEEPLVTLRCTRGALLALLAGVAPPPGEGAAIDGDPAALELVRGWIAATEFPATRASRRHARS
ncbi:hypothetical protein [Conexibacter arvalis]|uniref:Uncharacterized protein n=1 Tax=Conexibacter arvalis TaxID=912552 RepID=A0A840ILZ9_9ACTN|nr:hypothetical protein [Conexibacter arvalis]MBB4665281.1 hypothetical protein [Conexibacter arvalis]